MLKNKKPTENSVLKKLLAEKIAVQRELEELQAKISKVKKPKKKKKSFWMGVEIDEDTKNDLLSREPVDLSLFSSVGKTQKIEGANETLSSVAKILNLQEEILDLKRKNKKFNANLASE